MSTRFASGQRFWRLIWRLCLVIVGVAVLPSSRGVSAAAEPKAYVGLFKDNAVAVIDTATNSLLKTIPAPAGPHGLVVTPDARSIYVSSDGDSKVSVIDTLTDTVTATIEVGKTPH